MERRNSNSSNSNDPNEDEEIELKPNDALMQAAKDGVWTEILGLISGGAQVEGTFLDGEDSPANLLIVSSKYGHLECVKKILELGATRGHLKAMLQAAERGHIECFQHLMQVSFCRVVGDNKSLCEMLSMLKGGNFESVQKMLKGDDMKTVVNKWGRQLMNLLISLGCPTSCVQTLIDCGVDMNYETDDTSLSPLKCSIYSNNVACFRFLRQCGALFDCIDDAIYCRNDECLEELVNCIPKQPVRCYMDWVKYIDKTSSRSILLKYLDSVNSRDRCGMTLLMWACEKNSLSWAEFLLEKGADANFRSNRGDTALTISCNKGHYEIVELLLKHNVNVNEQFVEVTPTALSEAPKENMIRKIYDHSAEIRFCSLGENALLVVCRKGHDNILDLLLKHKANPFVATPHRYNGIMVAAMSNNLNCVKKLIENFGPINQKNDDGQTAMMLACSLGYDEIVDILLKNGADVNTQDNTGRTPLMRAAMNHESVKCVKLLLEHKANVHLKNKKGRTALMIASAFVNDEVLDLLIGHGSDVNAQNAKGRSPLMYAAVNESVVCLQNLLDHGADIDAKNKDGDTALMISCVKGYEEVVEFLIKNKANVNVQNNDGKSAIVLASFGNGSRIISKLVESGADINMRTTNGDTALMFACATGKAGIADVLVENGADVNAINKDGRSAILFAMGRHHTTCVQKLIHLDADLDVVDTDGATVFSVAIEGDHDVFKSLIDSGKLSDGNVLKSVHKNAIMKEGNAVSFSFKNILLTMERDMFDWKWCNVTTSMPVVIQAAVVCGISPCTIDLRACNNASPLFIAYIMEDISLLTYILSNLYFHPDHCRRIYEFPRFKNCHNTDDASDADKVIVEKLLARPLSLQTWSFLSVSEAISHAGTPSSRANRVNKLPLPESLKRALKFETSNSCTCMDDLVHQEESKLAGDSIFSGKLAEICSDSKAGYCLHCAEQSGKDGWETDSD